MTESGSGFGAPVKPTFLLLVAAAALLAASGYNAITTGALTILATAPANEAFRGMAFAPASPGSLAFTTIDVPGATDTGASGINSLGQIMGGYALADGTRHGFLLAPDGSFTPIDDPDAT